MKKTLLMTFCCLFCCSLLFSAYDENKFMQAGKSMISKGQYDQAIKVFNYVIKQNPKNSNAMVYAAYAYMKKGDKATAKRYLEAAYNLTGDPKIKKQIDALDGQSGRQNAATSGREAFNPFHFGLKAGLNLANLTGDDVAKDADMLMGFCGGAFVSYAFTPWFSLQPEVLYSQKGTSYEYASSESDYQSKESWNLNYVEIPVLAKFSIPTGSAFTPVIYAGPAISIKTGASIYNEKTISGITEKKTVNISEVINSTDFSLVAGAGVEIKVGPGAITLEVRYDMGLTTIINNNDNPVKIDVKTTAIAILAGYSF
ncbi:MAG: outer membrane beta-barrel protein [Candidatus Goldbacteria bacterium]|nr:outer membrane beta-barrel protein [Candidatus Goldiibacteriota bacterium]